MNRSSSARDRPISACQRCRMSKVRCDRAQPRCGRCTKMDTVCHYEMAHKILSNEEDGSGTCRHGLSLQTSEPMLMTNGLVHGAHNGGSQTSPSGSSHGSLPLDQFTIRDASDSSNLPKHSQVAPLSPSEVMQPTKARRDRAVLSCARCRKHKLRCDRRMPCGRCIKGGWESECVYTWSQKGPTSDGAEASGRNSANDAIATTFYNPAWKTAFRNGAHWRKLLPQIKSHLPSDPGKHHDSNAHHEHLSQAHCLSINFPLGNDNSSTETVRHIVAQLPPRALQRTFVSHYTSTVEQAFHLLDEAAFEQQLQGFWNDEASMPDDWLAQYFMILCLGCQAHNFAAKEQGGNVYADLPSVFMHGAEFCLKQTLYLFKPTLCNIRMLCLTVISKQVYVMSCHESDTCWPLTGLIKRLSIRLGLHIPAGPGDGQTAEVREKTRLWATVVFLELKQSLVCGMPVLMRQTDFACFGFNRLSLPASPSSLGDASPSLAMGELGQTWLERTFSVSGPMLLRALDIATSADGAITYEEVVNTDTSLRWQLKQSGVGLNTDNLGTDECNGAVDLESCTAHLFLRLVLTTLHSPFALHPTAPSAYPESYVSSLESALAILSHQRRLCEEPARSQQAAWFAGLFRHEFFTAAMTVCAQLVRHGHALGLPAECGCDGQPRQIVLGALQSCRDVWSREREASICNANAFAVVDDLVRVLREVQE